MSSLSPEAVGCVCQDIDPDEPDQEIQHQCPHNEAWEPEMLLRVSELQQRHAQVEENDAVHGGAQHADKVVHRDVRLLWDIFKGVVRLNNATTWDRKYF